ncbi:heat-inducible transcriptional repressor HrcA [Geminicoccus roseus]|uniref:heat-inducible transcriptional repressor HrcA n=1 Tax=Geminicoccus roseus TaxID=404900 RepID=UPI0003FADD87|nr:heat-inducible transcriptional repressor HrcA [Geminicoccus roseus]
MITELNSRSRQIFRQIVDAYVTTGEPVGSRTIARKLDERLSPATIRNVMADLEDAGLLFAPHTSAGRLPTAAGLRLYVDGLLEVGNIGDEDKRSIRAQCVGTGKSLEAVLGDATEALSGLTRHAGLVAAPASDRPFRHVEFVSLGPGRALVVTVTDHGMVENRIIDVPLGMPQTSLVEAGNYMTARLSGRSFAEARIQVHEEIEARRAEIDEVTQRVVEAGLATWVKPGGDSDGFLIVRGQSKLLEDVQNLVELERVRHLFETLETRKNLLRLVEAAQSGNGVQIFIGAENELFGLSGCSMVIAPYRAPSPDQSQSAVVGAIGVIGPTRMNYARIIPMVDYTARVVSRMLGHHDNGSRE